MTLFTQYLRFARYLAIAVGLVLCHGGSASASIESRLGELAKSVAKTLNSSGHDAVGIQVTGPATFQSSGPALVKEVLGAELKKLGIEVKINAAVGLAGKLKLHNVTELGGTVPVSLEVIIEVALVDENESPLASFETAKFTVNDRSEVARIMGIPFDAKGGATNPDAKTNNGAGNPNNVLIGKQNPNQAVQDSIVRATANSQFGIEVQVGGQGRTATLDSGLAFVPLSQNDECEIRLVNDADFEVAVELNLDGVDSFWFTDRHSGLWLVSPRSSQTVRGWQLNGTLARKFRVVPFEDSVAAKAGVTGQIGVISANFYRAYQPNEEIPTDDKPNAGGRTKGLLGIGEGKEIENKVNFVDRKLGRVRACVPVRYQKPQ